MIRLSKTDRLLILAPHPDDETLGAGGLIQRANSMGVATHVVFATDGDDNPWPQRFLERRWRLSASDRRRWGLRRREEARQALAALGSGNTSARFLQFPDQGLTDELMRGDMRLPRLLLAELERFQPTCVCIPAIHDRHPDHSALHVLARFAIDAWADSSPKVLEYSVHHPRLSPPSIRAELKLLQEEIEKKRSAILCHVTQVALSRRRFLGYVRDTEAFVTSSDPEEICNGHTIFSAGHERGALVLRIDRSQIGLGSRVLVAFHSPARGEQRWSLAVGARSMLAPVWDEVAGAPRRNATIRRDKRTIEVRIPIAGMQPVSRLFVKLKQRVIFLDAVGWREVPVIPAPEEEEAVAQLEAATAL